MDFIILHRTKCADETASLNHFEYCFSKENGNKSPGEHAVLGLTWQWARQATSVPVQKKPACAGLCHYADIDTPAMASCVLLCLCLQNLLRIAKWRASGLCCGYRAGNGLILGLGCALSRLQGEMCHVAAFCNILLGEAPFYMDVIYVLRGGCLNRFQVNVFKLNKWGLKMSSRRMMVFVDASVSRWHRQR